MRFSQLLRTSAIKSAFCVLVCAMLVQAFPAAATAQDGIVQPGFVRTDDPNGFYGGCRLPEWPSGVRRKADIVREAGGGPELVSAIAVIDCHGFDGGGGSHVAPCPESTEYSYCVLNSNDGAGNHVLLGVVVDTVAPRCKATARRAGPTAQIDITVHDPGTGIASITLRDENNVQTHHYFTDHRAPVVLTATKIDQERRASFGILVRDGAGNLKDCGYRF
jgi:hypothetical protein